MKDSEDRHPDLDRMTVKDFLVAYGRPPDSITIGEMLAIYRAQALIIKARAKQGQNDRGETTPIGVIDLSESAGALDGYDGERLFEQAERKARGEELEPDISMPEIERQVRRLRAANRPPASPESLVKRFGVPAIRLSTFEINEETLALVPREVCAKHCLIPVNRVREILIVAMADPSNIYAIDEVRFISNCSVEVVVASAEDIATAIARYYP